MTASKEHLFYQALVKRFRKLSLIKGDDDYGISEIEWKTEVQRIISRVLPHYNYVIHHGTGLEREVYEGLKGVVFRDAVRVRFCCYYVIIFQEGEITLIRKHKHLKKCIYGGSLKPDVLEFKPSK